MQAIKSEEFGNYWTRTETYESLKIYIDLDMDGLKEAVIRMLGGEKVKIMTGSFQNDMTNIKSKDDVLTLMVHLGYLAYDSNEKSVFIPNEEVREEFVLSVTKGKHTELARLIKNSDRLPHSFKNYGGDIYLVGINYDENTKKHTCKIERHKKQIS